MGLPLMGSRQNARWSQGVLFFGAAVLSVLGWIAGCSQILGIDSNRYVDAGVADTAVQETAAPDAAPDVIEAGVDAGVEAGPWSCLGQPPQLYQAGAMTSVTLLTVNALEPIQQAEEVDGGSGLDLISYTALSGVSVRGCSTLLNPACNNGTATPADGGYEITDEGGTAPFTLLQSWDGFYELSYSQPLFTTTFYPGHMVAGQTSVTVPAALLTAAGESVLEGFLPGVQAASDQDGGEGSVVFSVYDCQDHFAPGVQFIPGSTIDAGPYPTTIFYLKGSNGQELPTTSADETDQGGAGGILNVPIGSFTVTAIVKATGQTITTLSVYVNPGVAAQVIVRARTE
jgi:hypothetical protein